MIDGSEKHNRQLAFELQNSHVCEKRSKLSNMKGWASLQIQPFLHAPRRQGRLAKRP